jgi:hypothetical protein
MSGSVDQEGGPGMKASTCGIVIALLLAIAGIAQAGLLKGDPRVCAFGGARTCAQQAAVATAKRALSAHYQAYPWTWATECSPVGTNVLQWTCRTFHDGGGVTLGVAFKRVNGTWTRRVAFAP